MRWCYSWLATHGVIANLIRTPAGKRVKLQPLDQMEAGVSQSRLPRLPPPRCGGEGRHGDHSTPFQIAGGQWSQECIQFQGLVG